MDYELDTPEELAAAFHAERELGMKNGMLVTNPIPEKYSMDHKVIDKAIELGTISADKKEVLNDWLANPWTWAARHALTPMDNEN